jgi:hypothetical protein
MDAGAFGKRVPQLGEESYAPQDYCDDAEHYHFDQGVLFHGNVPPFNKLLTTLLYNLQRCL